jgi:uncharacterized protein YdaU (DUF1376 family)
MNIHSVRFGITFSPGSRCHEHRLSNPFRGGVPTNFYRRFPGDYLRDTQHLTALEHGIYTLLLDTLYATEKPIRSRENAYRIVRCRDDDEPVSESFPSRAECDKIIDEFFIENRKGITHKRVKEEIKMAQNRAKIARFNGLHGGRPKTQQKPSGLAKPNPEKSSPDSRLPDSRLQTTEESKTNTQTVLVPPENAFQTFWRGYPKKVNEKAAFREWVHCIGIHEHLEEILTVIMKYETSGLWDDPKHIPNPESFIRDRRWRDEVPQGGNRGKSSAEQRTKRVREAAKNVLGTDGSVGRALLQQLLEGSDGGDLHNLAPGPVAPSKLKLAK